jgi:hypothetical protein
LSGGRGSARERAEGLRRQIAELSERLVVEEERICRLEITRETMTELLAEAGEAAEPVPPGRPGGAEEEEDEGEGEREAASGGASPIGVMTVPSRRPGIEAAVLPQSYRDILEVLTDAGRPLRAGHISAALGLPTDAVKVEGLRSKLKRLVVRGWLTEPSAGLFTPAP